MGQVEAAASDAVDFQLLGPGPNTTQGLCEHQQEPTYLDPQRHAGPIRVYGQYGSVASREEEPWSRPGPTPVGIPQTPRGASQGQSFASGRGYRLSTASRLPAGTPLTRGFSNLHAGYTAQRNPSSARSRGLGVGLSAGIRASQTGNGPAEPRETTPHHKVASRPVLVPSAFGPLTSM
ncbi:hypothetical protein CGCF415_v012775 [Colletotrichum fructicola]|uniref:Uncharacterized protein n=1 Tax=Colletotrichum fructicola (strain Nara gc5) TaxID=1213859 RepID=A0A7J6J766_COLFN|nr:uncharacterized protein CGMCC3_g16672 [Colletotrichum fructicola]KAF4485742.1 hypothetical protein CGGC5_v005324 [Colletotrichum fructicola Nara gc5]KAE9567149.1 hypothetical protein CGMCC3_g16672 [Colletotrichum fructicola]KAF4885580.1 hypothetical protein CGCFRS4_v011834 [Colletotrichum fructicola]KAF4893175.1 hypothetical protein CGCF415_v012775 [Colletotrichum fructicola]KAF4927875.1 hypothetical protein CGCF245_v012954 [Colletotrichum fructicola]